MRQLLPGLSRGAWHEVCARVSCVCTVCYHFCSSQWDLCTFWKWTNYMKKRSRIILQTGNWPTRPWKSTSAQQKGNINRGNLSHVQVGCGCVCVWERFCCCFFLTITIHIFKNRFHLPLKCKDVQIWDSGSSLSLFNMLQHLMLFLWLHWRLVI